MTRIALITTGKAEYGGLAASLKRVFPDVDFVPAGQPNSFTSSTLSWPAPTLAGEQGPVDQIARLLVGAVDVGKKRDRADFAIAVEDLELANRHQPDIVVRLFAAAVQRHLAESWPSDRRRQRAVQNARERCSFHLFVPMLESYFFGDPGALTRAGAKRAPRLPPDIDVEDFDTLDEEFLRSFDSEHKRAQFRRHPKRYLRFLSDNAYRESRHGRQALEELDWQAVLSEPTHVQFLRSLFLDIADMLATVCPFPGKSHPITWCPGAPNRFLRNIAPSA